MNSIKYVGLDVHRDTIAVAVLNADGKLEIQSVIATQAATMVEFLRGLRGALHVTFEEGTHSAWLYDLLVRHVAKLMVCNPRQNALLKAGSTRQTNSRIGGTVAVPITQHQSLKFSYSDGTYIRFGGNYQNVSVAWQYAWLGKPK